MKQKIFPGLPKQWYSYKAKNLSHSSPNSCMEFKIVLPVLQIVLRNQTRSPFSPNSCIEHKIVSQIYPISSTKLQSFSDLSKYAKYVPMFFPKSPNSYNSLKLFSDFSKSLITLNTVWNDKMSKEKISGA
jgi:hypothetical protein